MDSDGVGVSRRLRGSGKEGDMAEDGLADLTLLHPFIRLIPVRIGDTSSCPLNRATAY